MVDFENDRQEGIGPNFGDNMFKEWHGEYSIVSRRSLTY
jgi:hypothetical protein